MTRLTAISLATFALAACAGAGQTRPGSATAADAAQPDALTELQRETTDQERRIAELEARLGLLEQEAREWRHAVPLKPSQTVRIGARRSEGDTDDDSDQVEPRRRVAVVRLHEREPEPAADEPLMLPEPPPGVGSKLAVVPMPEERASKALRGALPAGEGGEREQYRAGLRALRDQRWDDALQAFTRFLGEHPGSDLAEQATYWRGEAHYAQRRYRDALIDFETVVLRPSRGSKTADALLKLGLCHQRLGDSVSAERYFRQLREQYPSSDAARIASRENPS